MTNDPNLYITVAVSGLAGLGMITTASLAGWRGWLALKREELHDRHAGDAQPDQAGPSIASRIEVADLKERIRKLEAIAAGVDL
ncbi:MAG: hypothetical protein EOP62_17650 [Sphingomonadales bacterium]|nr:MAG: hypothetical protein EOP62_17650 [Sphingomonadales bacterium]